MKLNEIIERIEGNESFTSSEYEEVISRMNQIKTYFTDIQLVMVFDYVTNNGFIFYILDVDELDSFVNETYDEPNQVEEVYSTLQAI